MYHRFPAKRLHRYVNEFAGRLNIRCMDTIDMMVTVVRIAQAKAIRSLRQKIHLIYSVDIEEDAILEKLDEMKGEMKAELRDQITEIKAEMRETLGDMKSEMRDEFKSMKSELKQTYSESGHDGELFMASHAID